MPMSYSPLVRRVAPHPRPLSPTGRGEEKARRVLEELDRRAVDLEGDDRLLPVGQPAHLEAVAAVLAQAVLRPHLLDPDAEQLLGRRLDLALVGPLVHLERVRPPVRRLVCPLLGDQRPDDDLVRLQLRAAPPPRLAFRLGRHTSPPAGRGRATSSPTWRRPSCPPAAADPGPPASAAAASAAAPCRR